MQIKVRNLCNTLIRITFTGNQEEWGEHTQQLFDLYKSLIERVGDQIAHLTGETADDIIAAICNINLLPKEAECLPILRRSLNSFPTHQLSHLIGSCKPA